MTMRADIAIVGAGIGGASLAYFLAGRASVVMIEAEALPGFHATGRSAAFFAETYGGPIVQPLTTASKSFLRSPPDGFVGQALIGPRGALHVAKGGGRALDMLAQSFADTGVSTAMLDADEVRQRAPLLRKEWAARALWEPECSDIDVAALHAAFLRGAKARGAKLITGARMAAAERASAEWRIELAGGGTVEAGILVNAAGAWVDEVARMAGVPPLGIVPMRRTMIVADLGAQTDALLPLIIDAEGELYFKPDGGHMWVSPHDEVPVPAADVQPEEIDVAIAIDRFEKATTKRVSRVVRKWAGLRSFAPDRLPVYGFDPGQPGLFWCAGQGGFGIQTAPAAGALAAALLLGERGPGNLNPDPYDPARFR